MLVNLVLLSLFVTAGTLFSLIVAYKLLDDKINKNRYETLEYAKDGAKSLDTYEQRLEVYEEALYYAINDLEEIKCHLRKPKAKKKLNKRPRPPKY